MDLIWIKIPHAERHEKVNVRSPPLCARALPGNKEAAGWRRAAFSPGEQRRTRTHKRERPHETRSCSSPTREQMVTRARLVACQASLTSLLFARRQFLLRCARVCSRGPARSFRSCKVCARAPRASPCAAARTPMALSARALHHQATIKPRLFGRRYPTFAAYSAAAAAVTTPSCLLLHGSRFIRALFQHSRRPQSPHACATDSWISMLQRIRQRAQEGYQQRVRAVRCRSFRVASYTLKYKSEQVFWLIALSCGFLAT